jgi:Flp pilus assembly protein TadD
MAWLKKRAWKLGLAGLVLAPLGCGSLTGKWSDPVGSFGSHEGLGKPVAVAGPRAGELPTTQAIQVALSIGQSAEKAGNEDAALEQYEKVRALDKDNVQAARRLAVLYDKHGEFSKADAEYRKVVKVRPRDPDVFNDWGYSHYLRNHSSEAEKHLRHALALAPDHARAHCNLGLVLGQQERYSEALQAFRDAHLSEAEAHCDLAFIYLTKGKLEDARREAQAASKLDSGCTKARDVLAKLETMPPPASAVKTASAKEARPPRSPAKRPSREELKAQAEAAVAGVIILDNASSLPTAAPVAPAANASSPVVYQSPNGTKWIPVSKSEPRPAVPSTSPPPSDGGVSGTITFE